MPKLTNDEKVAIALAQLKAGQPVGSSKRRARVQAALGGGNRAWREGSSSGLSRFLSADVGGSGSGGGGSYAGRDLVDEVLRKVQADKDAKPPSDSAWAKGLGLVGKALNVLDLGGSYLRSSASAVARGVEEGDPTKVLGGIPVVNQVANTIDNFGGDPNAPKGLLSKVVFADKKQEKDFWAHKGTGDYLQEGIDKHGWQDSFLNNDWVKRAVGLTGDIGLDPLTYLSGGAKMGVEKGAKVATVAAEAGVEQLAKESLVEGAEQLTRQAAKEGLEQGATKTATALADDVAESTSKSGRVKFKDARWSDWDAKARDIAATTSDPAEREWALGVVERLRNGAHARSIASLSSAEVAQLGGKRAIFVAGTPVLENSKVVESALRAREALGGASRRAVNKTFNAVVKEGTFGNQAATKLMKGAMQAGGDSVARALDAIETEKWARHTSGIEATNLGREGTAALDALAKAGFDEGAVFRTVQDENLFRQAVEANPAAGEALDRVRGVWRSMAGAMLEDSGKVLDGGDTYAPHFLTDDAMEFLNKNPEARKQIPGVSAFEKTRSLRSGQDDTVLLSKMESTMFYGRKMPRNLSDAEAVDWLNARFRAKAGVDYDLFESNIRKVFDRSVGNYATARHKALFTGRMAERRWMGDDIQRIAKTLVDPEARSAFVKEQAASTLAEVFGSASAAQAQVDFVNDVERLLVETRGIGKRVGKPWDDMVARYRALSKSLADGTSVKQVVNELERQRVVAIGAARRADGDLAKLYQAEVDFLSSQIRKIRSSMGDLEQGAYAGLLRNIATGGNGAIALRGDLEAGGGRRVDMLRSANEPAAQRARTLAEKNAPITARSRQEATGIARQVWDSVGEIVAEALSVKAVNKAAKQGPPIRTLSANDAFIYGGRSAGVPGQVGGAAARSTFDLTGTTRNFRVKQAQDAIRTAVEDAGYTFTGLTENLDRITAADLKKKLQQELLDQVHAKAAALAGENAYQQRMLKGVSKEANRILGPLNEAADQMAEYRQQLKQIPDPARYELMDFVGDNPKAAALFDRAITMTLRADVLQSRKIDAALAEHARLQGELDDLAQAMGLAGRDVSSQRIAVSASGEASFATEPQTTGQMRKLQRDAALLAGGIADEAERKIVEGRMKAGMAEEHAKKLADMFFDEKAAKRQEQPWKRTKNLSSKPTRQARQKARGVFSARDRALIVQNEGQIEQFVQNAFANTVRDSFKELPTEVQELFLPVERFFKNEGMKSFLDVYDKINNSLKAWLIAKPGFVFRNVFGGLFVNMIAGVSPEAHFNMLKWRYADFLRERGRPGLWNRLSDYDKLIYKSTREIQSASETLVGSMVQKSAEKSVFARVNPGSSRFFYLAANQGFNEFAENTLLRGSMVADMLMKEPRILAAMQAGDNIAVRTAIRDTQVAATRKVGFFHFDYDRAAKSPFENEVLSRVVPFYTYTKNVIPMLTSMMVERPKYFAWANSVARNIQLGVPEDEVLPEYIKESGAVRTPFTVNGNRVYWMQDLPFNQLIDIGNEPGNFAASSLSPLVKTPIEMLQGQQFYKRIPLTADMKESQYQNVPVVSQLLSAAGAQRPGDDGKTQFMRQDWQYLLGQLAPPLYQTANYLPATDTQGLKLPTRVLSDTTGVRLRVNTPEDQANELARQKIKEREQKAKKTREKKRGYSGG